MATWIFLAWLVLAVVIGVVGFSLARRRARRGGLDASFEDSIPSMEPWDDEPLSEPPL